MALWIYMLSVPVPGLLLACVPVRRARSRALAEPGLRWKHLSRVLLLLAVLCVLVILAVSLSQDYPNTPQFWRIACIPGIALAAVRLTLEAKYVRRFFFNHVR
ncbi:hypothetical protein [Kribbella sp. NPDC003557]|uniref:hypothetical protein n=1 Tax=Kribbella sp. NPDC003557 TaxID=3154449 RepID=UPI0033A266B1